MNDFLDCVIITHFHLDHCGALPHLTEMIGYNGPIYMTHPTKAICPILLEDYRRITVERKGETNFFTAEMIAACMRKARPVYLHEVVRVDDALEIKAYYAGHVLGAAMFLVRSGSHSVLYTGDYNMTPDRHLGAAWVDRCSPDLLITESTYATTIRDSKRCRERDFLKKVHNCVEAGGKVLIPVFALGRAQELCILVETYWERMNLSVPIYFTVGMAERANHYYKLFISWTNEKIRETFVKRNMFDFRHIKPFDKAYVDNPGPMVVFATPGMLHAGQSLQIFKKWASNEKNMVIIPGYCVAGTVGYKLLNGAKRLDFDKQSLEVKLRVEYLSFSAHADAKGIMQLVRLCGPKSVLLVHGERAKMQFLREKIVSEMGLPCHMPANGESISLEPAAPVLAEAPAWLLRKRHTFPREAATAAGGGDDAAAGGGWLPSHSKVIRAGLVLRPGEARPAGAQQSLHVGGRRPHRAPAALLVHFALSPGGRGRTCRCNVQARARIGAPFVYRAAPGDSQRWQQLHFAQRKWGRRCDCLDQRIRRRRRRGRHIGEWCQRGGLTLLDHHCDI